MIPEIKKEIAEEYRVSYRILVNYLKDAIQKEAYISSEEIKKILKALEEVE